MDAEARQQTGYCITDAAALISDPASGSGAVLGDGSLSDSDPPGFLCSLSIVASACRAAGLV